MGRSLKKGPYVDAKLALKVERQKESGGREPITTWARECTVVPDFVGHTFMVHNGRTHLKVFVTEDMVGHRLGEFSPTRVFRGHSTRKPEAEGTAAPASGSPGKK
jgi:small subunit ribosomal protein S19